MSDRKKTTDKTAAPGGTVYTARSAYTGTDSAPVSPPKPAPRQSGVKQAQETGALASSIPYNSTKASEYDEQRATCPFAGDRSSVSAPLAAASTLSEKNISDKTGAKPADGQPVSGALDATYADNTGQSLTTNHGVPVADNQNSLTAGSGGAALLKDFILREKITHFDHERIPERIVHARGSGAHGFFECTKALADVTQATVFAKKGKKTPVFVRFSTVAGERGSKDTARDVRGFAVKFYSDQGNWDLVGNNMPVFFIQDAMKFPDLVHAVKPEPHHGMPQAASAHDTFWDFVSLMPESAHMLMWQMSDRAIPRSYRMMQGFGVHTFRFINTKGEGKLVKFHWTPTAGTHSLVWDEAVKISGADPDYHRRDLWEAIENGHYPEWELGVQIFSEEQADTFSFDVLDATKLIPEELVPVVKVGRLVLNRNPDNFFAETEQVAFCTAHVIPGIDFTNDPLLAGRIHSYVDTQISRLGGANFHEIPINRPLAAIHNNQRDGMHRQTINRGRVSYEPNSLGGGCPFQSGSAGFISFPEPVVGFERRAKPEKFAEHFQQATLFFESQSEIEKQHIAAAFVFELSKVTVNPIRERTVSLLRNVSESLAVQVADGLGMELPNPMPKALEHPPEPQITKSPPLSLFAHPGEASIKTRTIAILVHKGTHANAVISLAEGLIEQGAAVRLVGPRIGLLEGSDSIRLDADASLDNHPAVVFDAVIIPDGKEAIAKLSADGRALDFVREQFRHCKTILAIGSARNLLEKAGITGLDSSLPGVLLVPKLTDNTLSQFTDAVIKHRHYEREQTPPPV